MGLTSNTGLLASVPQRPSKPKPKNSVELRCEAIPAPFVLRPYAGLYNPFSHACSILCNHPADTEAKEYVRRAKDALASENKVTFTQEEAARLQENALDKEKYKTPHDIVTEDMFRRYTETDSRPLTPAPTLASGKSRGSRRCLTPDQPQKRAAIVVDLRRSHSQETLYYHGYTTSEMTVGRTASATNDRSTLPSLNLSEGAHGRLLKGQCQQLPPLASPLVLTKRTMQQAKEICTAKTARKNQLKALTIGKVQKGKTKTERAASQNSKSERDTNDGSETAAAEIDNASDEVRRRGKRRRKPRQGSDRLTSAGLAAQTQQDPETQIAGIGSESHNPSSRGSVALSHADDYTVTLPVVKSNAMRANDSFLDDDILKYLHRDVDQEAIETEFDIKRRYVLKEALRTRPDRPHGQEMQSLLKELKVPAPSLGDWLHVPRVFSRQHAEFSLPIDSNALETLTPMTYAARYVTMKKSKQLLYLTALRKFQPGAYTMPITCMEEGLMLMMGGILSAEQAQKFGALMEWKDYEEEENFPDDFKLNSTEGGFTKNVVSERGGAGDNAMERNLIKYRTWCGVCAVCERMYGRFPPRDKDPPDGMEVSDFSMLETRLATLKLHSGLNELLHVIRTR